MKPEELIIYSDFDGTIAKGVGTKAEVSKENQEAIKSFIKAGGKFGMASGRIHKSIDSFFDEVYFNMPYVESNGAMVYDRFKDSYIAKLPLDKVFKEYAYDFADKHKLFLTSLDEDQSYRLIFNDDRDKVVFDFKRELMSYEEYLSKDIFKVAFLGDKKAIDETLEIMKTNACFNYISYARSGDIYIEIYNTDAGKWHGIKKAIDYMNFKNRKIICIGDHYNDIEMIENADIAICPENAIKEVKEKADYIMKTNLLDALRYLDSL